MHQKCTTGEASEAQSAAMSWPSVRTIKVHVNITEVAVISVVGVTTTVAAVVINTTTRSTPTDVSELSTAVCRCQYSSSVVFS